MESGDYEEYVLGEGVPLDQLRFSAFAELSGSDFTGAVGEWGKVGGIARSVSFRGALDYGFESARGNIYKLLVSLGCSLEPREENLNLYVDGTFLGKCRPVLGDGVPGECFVFTPYLPAGSHIIRLEWDNHRPVPQSRGAPSRHFRAGRSGERGGQARSRRAPAGGIPPPSS